MPKPKTVVPAAFLLNPVDRQRITPAGSDYLARATASTPPTAAAAAAAEQRARQRLGARLKLACGVPVEDWELWLLADEPRIEADEALLQRMLRARGLDPIRDTADRRTRLLRRAVADARPDTGR